MDSTHFALMDQVYRRQRYIYDFTRKYYLFGRDRLIADLALKPGDSVVEIGCGTARNLIKMARRYPETRFYGLDASAEMLRTAESAINRAGLSGRIQLAHGLAEDLSPGMFGLTTSFSHAVFSYSLSMIPDWKQALNRASQEAESVHVVDFGDLSGMGPLGARLMNAWLALFHVTPRAEILRRLESMEHGMTLDVLPVRYAFIWRGESTAARSLAV